MKLRLFSALIVLLILPMVTLAGASTGNSADRRLGSGRANIAPLVPRFSDPARSSNVAYVTDFRTGINDTCGPGCGSSILTTAVTGIPIQSGGTYNTTTGHAVKFTDVYVSTVDSNGLAAISGYDTVMLYEVCDIASHPSLISALNSFLVAGLGKVVIFDGDRCAPISAGSANYTTFLFPFTSSNPGPRGATGSITFVENETLPATLTRNVTNGFVGSTDAVGDSNTFTSNAGGWCAALNGTNTLGAVGIQVGYARTPNGGLAIWDGNDNWFTFGPNAYDKLVFENILDQPFKPDSLPCGVPVIGIKLSPLTATNRDTAGTRHTVTATVSNSSGKPLSGVTVTFNVTNGLNAGIIGTAITNGTGMASFTYATKGGAGTDTIVSSFKDQNGVHVSNAVTKTWTPPLPPPAQQPADVKINGTVMPSIFWLARYDFCKNLTVAAPTATSVVMIIQFTGFDGPPGFIVTLKMVQVSPHYWCVIVPSLWPHHGPFTVSIIASLPNGAEVTESWSMWVDPSGVVTDAKTKQPIENATVTLEKCTSLSGSCSTATPGTYTPNVNPETTNFTGSYGWNVTPGFWRVYITAKGYPSKHSPIVEVPPPVTNLNVALAYNIPVLPYVTVFVLSLGVLTSTVMRVKTRRNRAG